MPRSERRGLNYVQLLQGTLVSGFNADEWAQEAATTICDAICRCLAINQECSVILTGGKTAERLYRHWFASNLPYWQRVQFFLGDERCVPANEVESNYGMVMRTLFPDGMPSGCSLAPMEADDQDREAAARRYEQRFPERIDVLLLGVGSDGHIASLFPGSSALESDRSVVPVVGSKNPRERLTITPRVIRRARSVFLLATGVEKGQVLKLALQAPEDISALPVRLTLGRTWLLDGEARAQLN